MDYTHVIAIAAGLLAGLIAGLKIVAPLTKNTVDDKVLAAAEKVEAIIDPPAKK